MSYDLMVFEVGKAPTEKNDFMQWYEKLTEWEEGYRYDDISICCSALQNWYHEMLERFPSMNGPDAPSDEELDEDEDLESRLTDYCIAKDAIYVAFSWSQADSAYEAVRTLAQKHGVGFFDVSSAEGEVILPG